MDKKIIKQLKELGITSEMLENTQEKIEIDVSGCREDIEKIVAELNLSMEDSDVRNAGGGDFVVISGQAGLIVTLLQMLQSAYGSGFEIGMTSIAGVAIITSSIPAIKLILDKIKKRNDSKS